MSVFSEQEQFMRAGGQTTDRLNPQQASMYVNLIEEEVGELFDALTEEPKEGDSQVYRMEKILDGAGDSLVVIIGLLWSLGVNPQDVWDEIHGSNMSKIDPGSGRLVKRVDGKILKPNGYRPPNLTAIARAAIETLDKEAA